MDIGSNSVRLVVYERLSRSPTALFNEKILAGLGRGVGQTGRLEDERMQVALKALTRFKKICDHIGVTSLKILATAAAREASNGAAFIRDVERICGQPVLILSGRDEAYYSALGVISGFWKADGVVGDLGGGSLELVDLQHGRIGQGITFPLGGLRLQDSSERDLGKAAKIAKTELSKADWLTNATGRNFYAIGGTWRSLGRLHLFQEGYPLHVMHDYAIPAEVAIDFCDTIINNDVNTLPRIEVISKARRSLLPFGATVMRETLKQSHAKKVVFSALGVREGLLYDLLSQEGKKKDALLVASEELSELRARSPEYSNELIRWSNQIMQISGLDESAYEARLREAACYLADIGWRAHPDYRGQQSLNIISNAGFVQVDHAGRAYLAMAVFFRHEGIVQDALSPRLRALCSDRLAHLACVIGAIFRVASLISASISGVLERTSMSLVDGKLTLTLPKDLSDFDGERLRKRVNQLAKLMDLDGDVRVL
ncbi:Ppx/GppA family phosphatase [Rhodobacteraceae bacterium RKSG542]|nr:Ppx/GppA family phosphatase [Pseudovibrio flavus]